MTPNTYYYDRQIRRWILQFMAIFAGMQVSVGKTDDEDTRLITVPIHYGEVDRVVASVMEEGTQNKPIRLPAMAAYMRNIDIDVERMTGSGLERRNTYTPAGGLVPDDVKVVHQRKPVPYTVEMELSIMSSNQDQQFQILEQIFILFNPQLQIQTSDAPFDWTRLSTVFLKSNRIDSNYPPGADNRILRTTLSFEMPVWIDSPANVRRDFVERVYARIGAISASSITTVDIVAELDQQGIEYQLLFDASELDID